MLIALAAEAILINVALAFWLLVPWVITIVEDART